MRDFMRLLLLFRPVAGWLLLALLLSIIVTLLNLGIFAAIGGLMGGAAMLAFLRIATPLRLVLRYLERLVAHDATFRMLAQLRLWLLGRLARLAPLQLGYLRSADMFSRLMADINALDGLFLRVLLPLTLLVLLLAAGLAVLASISPQLAGMLALLLSGFALVAAFIVRRGSRAQADVVDLQSHLRNDVTDGLAGMGELLAAGTAPRQSGAINYSASLLVQAQHRAARAQALAVLWGQSLQGVLVLLAVVVTVVYAPPQYVLPVLLIMLAVAELLLSVPTGLMQLGRIRTSGQHLLALADQTPMLAEPVTPQPVPAELALVLENVSFAYQPGLPVLKDVSLTLLPGEQVALMGSSGSGKTSLAELVLKFITPQQGRLTVGDVDLNALDGDAWRRHIGYLGQRTRLVAGTIRENLQLAAPEADDARLWDVLTRVELAGFVRTLPEQLNSWVGEDGLQLSGGQARRLALAMVLLRQAPIWLLDEPLEGLDGETAAAVLATLRQLSHGQTLIYITHRADEATQMGITRILRLKDGHLLT